MSLYLGTTPIANTGYDRANTDLSNLTSQGQNIANWSSNVTNCITEIPQDIKVGLNNGGLYLKAGCKYCIPNGFEQDGVTPHFDFVTVNADTTSTAYGTGRTGCMVVWSTDHFEWSTLDNFHSGSTQPSATWWIWYDTTTNKIKHYNGSTIVEGVSFPICMITENAGTGYDSTVKSIDQVFNGFGYIGSTIFALPGVKGLIPNGRNDDGTLKNTETTANGVLTYTNQDTPTGNYYIQFRGNFISRASANPSSWRYDEERNIILWNNTTKQEVLFAGKLILSSGRVESLTPKTAFHALDYNDSSTISGWAMPSSMYVDLNLGASGATYTAPANGYMYLVKQAYAVGEYYYIAPVNEEYAWSESSMAVGQYMQVTVPWTKGKTYKITYNLSGPTVHLRFVYAEGEN